MNELNKLYAAMLMSWGGVVNSEGQILFQVYGPDNKITEVPLRIDDQILYLPLSEVLEQDCNGKVFFHPACENILSKETEVFKLIRRMTVMKLLTTFRLMPLVLAKVSDTKEKKSWKQDTLNMLEPIKQAKKGTLQELGRLFARMHVELEEDGLDNRFVHFKVTKGGNRTNPNTPRVYYKTKPSFPFYNEISKRLAHSEGSPDNHQVEINNHSFSRACLKLAQHFFQVILPAVVSPDEAEYESTQSVGARLVSYLGCYSVLADQINRVLSIFRPEFDKAAIYQINVEWTELFETLPEIYQQVPTLEYNSHNAHEEVVDNNFGRNDLGGLLSVSRTQQQVQQPNYPNNNQNNNNNQQQYPVQVNNGEFDVSRPPLEAGDQYQRYEIDYSGNGRVLHHALSRAGNPVVYECTKKGNLMRRVETTGGQQMFNALNPQMNMMGMPNMGMPMMNQPMMNNGMGGQGIMLGNGMMAMPVGNGYYQLPNGQIVPGPGAMTSTASQGGSNVVQSTDIGNSFGLY